MADLEASVDLSIAGALTRVAQLEAALKRATSVSFTGLSGTGISKASTDMRALELHTESVFRQFSRLAQVGSTMTKFVTLPIVAAGAASIALATQFDASMTNLVTRAGVAPAALGGIRKALLDMAPVVGSVPNELARGLELIEGDGIHGAKALDVLRASAEGTAIGLGSVKDVAAAVTTILNAYPNTVITASQATNVLTAAVKEGKVEASEMARQLGRVAEPAALIGVTVDETAGAIAALSRVTGNASQATTDFAGLLTTFIKPSIQAQKALDGVGLSSHQLLDTIKQKGLLAALDLLREKFGDNSLALGQLFRNTRGLTGFLGLTQDFQRTTAIFGETAKGFRDSGKDIDGFSTVSQTAAFKFKQAMADIQKAGIAFGETIAPAAATAAKGIAGLASGFADLPKPVKLGIEAMAGIAAIGGPVLVAVGQVGKLQTAIKGLPEGLQTGVAGLTKAVGTAVTSLAGFTSGFVATQGGATQAALGFAGAAASVGVAFAVGGPVAAGLTAVASIGGIVAGVFENDAKKAAALKSEAHTLAETLAKDLTPAMLAVRNFKIELPSIGTDAELFKLRDDIRTRFSEGFPSAGQAAIHAGGAALRDFADAAIAADGSVEKLKLRVATTTFSSPQFLADLAATGFTVEQLASASVKGKAAIEGLLVPRSGQAGEFDIINDAIGRLRGTANGLAGTFGKVNDKVTVTTSSVAELNVKNTEAGIIAARSAADVSNVGVAYIEATQAATGTAGAIAGVGAAQADFIAQFGESKLPVGIGILDKLGLTVDEVATSYNDLKKAALDAHDAVLTALNIPLSAARQQIKDAEAQTELIKDFAGIKGKTTTTGKGKTAKTTTTGDVQAEAFNVDTTGTIILSPEAIKVRTDLLDGLAGAQTKYVDAITAGGVAAAEAPAKYAAYIASLQETAKNSGLNVDLLNAFITASGATPEQVKTTIQTFGLIEALAKSDAYKKLLDSIDPVVATELQAATTGEERVKILVGYFNSLDPVEQRKLAIEVAGIADAEKAKKIIDETKSKTVTITVQANIDEALRGGANPGNFQDPTIKANGGIVHAANGYIPRISHIAAGRRGGITWAEPETGWEAYISGKPSMRARNEAILAETARRFGMEIYKQPRRFDSGGTINLPPVTISSDPRMNALLERMSALLDQGGKGDIIVQVEAPDSKNPDVFGARIGHAFRAAAL